MKTTEEIYEGLLAAFAQRAGFTPEADCDLSVRLYAAAAELQSLDIQAEWVLDQSFPQTAQGIYLDRHAQMRGIARTAATRAVGTIRFTVARASTAPLSIESGTVCMTADEVRFQTTADAVLEAGELSVDAPAEALEAGRNGNAAAGRICILTACPVGITGCTNPSAFTGGSDQEDDESLRQRLADVEKRGAVAIEGGRTRKGGPSNLPAQSMTGESGSPIRAEGAAPPVPSTMTEEDAGVNLYAGARQRGQLFPTKEAPCRVLHPGGQRGWRYRPGDFDLTPGGR